MVFYLSSRRRHTRYWRDWSSDVCTSDLSLSFSSMNPCIFIHKFNPYPFHYSQLLNLFSSLSHSSSHKTFQLNLSINVPLQRSEERRVGKVCRSRWSPYH